jgi:hypothetical protein
MAFFKPFVLAKVLLQVDIHDFELTAFIFLLTGCGLFCKEGAFPVVKVLTEFQHYSHTGS